MKGNIISIIAVALLVSCGGNQNGSEKTGSTSDSTVASISDETTPTDQEIADSWTYLYGRYLVIQQENHDINEEKVGYNKIKYNPLGSAQFVNPNLDVAYLESWIAVDKDHAVILNVPKIEGRYYTAELLDGWGEVITNINEHNYPKTPYGKFALILRGTNPTIPVDAVKIELPAQKIKMLARVELQGTPVVAQKLQRQFTLTVPPGIQIDTPMAIPYFNPDKPIGSAIFDQVDEVVASYPDVMPKGTQYQATAKKVALYKSGNDSAKARVQEVIATKAIPEFFKGAKGFGMQKGGWSVSYVAGKFGDDIMARDIINYGGLWANEIKEALYFIGLTDSDKQPLSGDKVYEIRYSKDALPSSAVNAFWSVTLYSVPDYRVVPNSLKRYGLNNVSKLKTNEDGSLSIWVSSSMPKGVPTSNWLPSPAGKGFSLNNRMYAPKPDVQEGKWFPPAIQVQK